MRTPRRLAATLCAVAAVGLAFIAGCKHVKPYQREHLAAPIMNTDPDPLAGKLDGHVQEYREGSIGGMGVGGGGCGCN